MRGLSLITMTMLFLLPMVSGTPTLAVVSAGGSTYVSEPASYTEGSLEKIVVLEDVSVLNGSYADTNLVDGLVLYLGTGFDGMSWFIGRSWFKFNLTEVDTPFYRATMYVHVDYEWGEPDEPVGVYYCEDDS